MEDSEFDVLYLKKKQEEEQEEQERRRQELFGSLAGRSAGNALAHGVDDGSITTPSQITETFNSSLSASGQGGPSFKAAALANAADGVDYAGQEVARQMEAEYQLSGRRLMNHGARELFDTMDGNFRNANFKSTLGMVKDLGRDHGVTPDSINADVFRVGLETLDRAGQDGDILKVNAVAQALLDSGLADKVSQDADGRDGFTQILEKEKAAINAASDKEEKDAQAADAEKSASQAQAFSSLVDSLAGANSAEKIAQVAGEGMENDPTAIETYGHRVDIASSLASNQARFVASGEKPQGNADTVAGLFREMDAGNKELLHDDEALERFAPDLLPEQLVELRNHRDELRKNPGTAQAEVVAAALDDIKVKVMGESETTYPMTKIKGPSVSVGMFSGLTMRGPDGEDMPTTKGREVRRAMEEAWQSVDPLAFEGKPNQLAAARAQAVEQVRDDVLASMEVGGMPKDPQEIEALLATRPQDLNNPVTRERLLGYVAPPDATPIAALSNISNLKNSETQEQLKTMVANTNMDKVLENMGVEPPPKRKRGRPRKEKQEKPFIPEPVGKPEDTMEDVFQGVAESLSSPDLPGQILREQASAASAEDIGLWDYGKAAATGVRNGFWYSAPESMARVTRRLGMWLGSDTLAAFGDKRVNELAQERENDPWAQPDPKWDNSFLASALYNGMEGVASSLTQAAVAAPAAIIGAKAGAVAGTTTMTGAFLGSVLGTNGLQTVAEIDRFADEAFTELSKLNPNITREEVEDKHFWDAIQSGLAEGGIGLVSDVLTGKLLKLVTKGLPTNLAGEALDKAQREALVEQARGILSKAFRNSSRSMLTEVPGELATAYVQNDIRKTAGLEATTAVDALKQALGPAIVGAGAFGVGGTIAKGVNNKLNPGESPAGILDLKTVGDTFAQDLETAARKDRYGALGHEFIQDHLVTSDLGPETGLAVGELLNGEASRWAEQNGRPKDEWWAKTREKYDAHKGADWSDLSALALSLITPDASFDGIVGNSLGSLTNALTADQKASLGDGDVAGTFKQWLQDPEQAGDLKPEVVESFEAMREKLLGSYGTLKEAGAVKISPEAQQMFEGMLKKAGKEAPPPPSIYKVKDEAGLVNKLTELADNTPENNDKIVQEFLKHSEYNFTPWTLGSDVKAVFATIDEAVSPYLEPILARQHDADMEARAAADMQENGYSPEHISKLFKTVVAGEEGSISLQLRKAQIYQSLAMQNTYKLAAEYSRDPSTKNAASLIAATEVYKGIHAEMRGVRSEAGRFLNAFKSAGRDHNYDMDKLSALVEDRGGEKTVKTIAEIIMTAQDPKDLSQKLEGGLVKRTREAIMEHYTLGMLTNPATHIVNIVGNASMLPWELGVRGMAEMDNRLSGVKDGVAKGETKAMVSGMLAGLKAYTQSFNALKDAQEGQSKYAKALLNMQDMEVRFQDGVGGAALSDAGVMDRKITGDLAGQVFDAVVPGKDNKYLGSAHAAVSNGLSVVADVWGKALNTSGSFLHGEDMLFKSIATHAELYARAHRHATQAAEAGGDYQAAYDKFMKRPPKDELQAIQDYGKKLTFQDDLGSLAGGVDKMRKAVPELRAAMPFLKTPVNILKYNISHLPVVNQVLGEVRKDLNSKDPARRQIAEARTIMGGLLITATMGLVESGVLTGGGPPNADERKKMEATGWQANSLKIGDTYISLDRADPLATYLNSVATLHELGPHLQGEDASQATLAVMGAVQRVIKDKTYLRGLNDLVSLGDLSKTSGQRAAANIASNLLPVSAFATNINKSVDPFQRDTSTFWNRLRSRIPSMSQDVPVRRNFLGEPLEKAQAPGDLNLLIPATVSKHKKDPLYDEVLRLTQAGYKIQGEMGNKIGTVAMDAKTYDRMSEHVHLKYLIGGKNCVDALRESVQSKNYQALDDESRHKLLFNTITRYRKEGKADRVRNDPDIRFLIGK